MFKSESITNGELWIELFDKKKEMVHTYDEVEINEVVNKIKNIFFIYITKRLRNNLKSAILVSMLMFIVKIWI